MTEVMKPNFWNPRDREPRRIRGPKTLPIQCPQNNLIMLRLMAVFLPQDKIVGRN